MIYYGKFNPRQLKWLQDQQERVDREIALVENSPAAPELGNNFPTSQETCDPHFAERLQFLLNELAPNVDIPLTAVPNVKACWDAQRCRLGKGIYISVCCIMFISSDH